MPWHQPRHAHDKPFRTKLSQTTLSAVSVVMTTLALDTVSPTWEVCGLAVSCSGAHKSKTIYSGPTSLCDRLLSPYPESLLSFAIVLPSGHRHHIPTSRTNRCRNHSPALSCNPRLSVSGEYLTDIESIDQAVHQPLTQPIASHCLTIILTEGQHVTLFLCSRYG